MMKYFMDFECTHTQTHIKYNMNMFARFWGSLLQDKSLPLLSIVDAVFTESNEMRVATRFIILIAGSIALIGR